MNSQKIGPYRIGQSLGRGGMGEVFRAFDTRLERWVAIKVIRVDRAASEVVRERFRREARAAAALTHPSIVQIHDIRSHQGADYIVMELIEGRTLADRFAAGPLSPLDAVHIVRQVVEGLAAAHDLGIVHRDLKADNIMVTASGQAKILDFGLAKRVAYSKEQSLTEDGGVIGTWYSMAPEQARGLEVDHRADLFSVGVMLYHATTGERPFRGTTPVETLTKVCVEPHRPAELLAPALPLPLCRLIDRLLQKDPAMRPRSAHAVAAELAQLETTLRDTESGTGDLSTVSSGTELTLPQIADSVVTWQSERPRPDLPMSTSAPGPSWRRARWATVLALATVAVVATWRLTPNASAGPRYVAVLPPRLGPIDALQGEAELGSAMRVAIERGVGSLAGLVAVAPDQVDAVAGDSVTIGRAVAADEVVTSELTCSSNRCQATVNRIDVAGGGLLASHTIEVPGDDLLELSSLVTRSLRAGHVGSTQRGDLPELDVRAADYDLYLQVRRAFRERRDESSNSELLDRLSAVASTSPRFFEASLLEAEIARFRFQETREVGDLERALGAAERARSMAPDDPRPWLSWAKLARLSDRLDDWEQAVQMLEALGVSGASVDVQRALLLERGGATEEALARMERAVERHPAWFNRFELADLCYRLGRIDDARRQLSTLLEGQPDHFPTQSFLARLELHNGSPERAAELYEALVARSSGVTELSNLGVAYLLLGRFADASTCFEQVVEESPETPVALLSLADATFLAGRVQAAQEIYQQVYVLATADPAASGWRMLTIRAQALAHVGSAQPAAALAQEALAIAGDNPQATYEAALVYALVGDRFSALVNAERAVALGTDVRWFSFPWFDVLRDEPSFVTLLEPAVKGLKE